jgi:hypothetical protein
VRRGIPLLSTDKAASAAAFSFAFATTRWGCPIDDSVPYARPARVPVAAGTALSVAGGMAWLRISRSA